MVDARPDPAVMLPPLFFVVESSLAVFFGLESLAILLKGLIDRLGDQQWQSTRHGGVASLSVL